MQNPQRGEPQFNEDEHDLLSDIIRRVFVVAGSKPTESDAAKIEAQIRAEWGGEQVYITQRRAITATHAKIKRDYQSGERVALLARRYSYSERRIRQILWPAPIAPLSASKKLK